MVPRHGKGDNGVREEDGLQPDNASRDPKAYRGTARGKTEKPQKGVPDPSKENYNFGGLGPNFNRDWQERCDKEEKDDGKSQKLL